MTVRIEKPGPVWTVVLDRPLPAPLRAEFERGVQVVGAESVAGARRFTERKNPEAPK